MWRDREPQDDAAAVLRGVAVAAPEAPGDPAALGRASLTAAASCSTSRRALDDLRRRRRRAAPSGERHPFHRAPSVRDGPPEQAAIRPTRLLSNANSAGASNTLTRKDHDTTGRSLNWSAASYAAPMAVIQKATLQPTKLELIAGSASFASWFDGDAAELAQVGAFLVRIIWRAGSACRCCSCRPGRGAGVADPDDVPGQAARRCGRRTDGRDVAFGARPPLRVLDGCHDPAFVGELVLPPCSTGGTEVDEVVEIDGEAITMPKSMAVRGSGTAGATVPDLGPLDVDMALVPTAACRRSARPARSEVTLSSRCARGGQLPAGRGAAGRHPGTTAGPDASPSYGCSTGPDVRSDRATPAPGGRAGRRAGRSPA